MYLSGLFFAATACMRVAYAEFLIVTEPPFPTSMIPTDLPDAAASSSWTTSVVFNAGVSFDDYTKGLGSTYQSSLTSIHSQVAAFVSTASNYSIPADVTDDTKTTTILGKPDWYSALPSEVVSWKEAEWVAIKSIASGVIAARQTTSGSKGAAPALQTPSAGLMNARWAVAGAAAAVFF